MISEPKVSVVIPVYNSEEFLGDTLKSVLAQSFKDMEVICVDDGSTDSSFNILQDFCKKDHRVQVLTQTNQYAGTARNKGMAKATGDYIIFLDSDDLFDREMIDKAYNIAQKSKADVIVFGGSEFRNDFNNAISRPDFARNDLTVDGRISINSQPDYIFNITNPAPWNKLFKRRFILDKGLEFEKTKRGNDVYFVEMAIALASSIYVLDEQLILYRRSVKNGLQETREEDPCYFLQPFFHLREELQKRNLYSLVEKSFLNLFLSSCIYNLETIRNEESFNNLYEVLKKNVFSEYGIQNTREDYYYNSELYRKYRYITANDADAYGVCGRGYKELKENRFMFPSWKIPKGSRIVLYGAGKVGQSFYNQIMRTDNYRLSAWVDRNVDEMFGEKVKKPWQVDYECCDMVVIALNNKLKASEVKEYLVDNLMVSKEKIVWEAP